MDMLEKWEATARLKKFYVEEEKLTLDVRSVRRSLSWQGTLLEWLKAASCVKSYLYDIYRIAANKYI
jgi:hypothetical protein